MLSTNNINKQIVNISSLINIVLVLGYIPNTKKYTKLNNMIICKTLNNYSNVFDKTFRQNLVHYYNIK